MGTNSRTWVVLSESSSEFDDLFCIEIMRFSTLDNDENAGP